MTTCNISQKYYVKVHSYQAIAITLTLVWVRTISYVLFTCARGHKNSCCTHKTVCAICVNVITNAQHERP